MADLDRDAWEELSEEQRRIVAAFHSGERHARGQQAPSRQSDRFVEKAQRAGALWFAGAALLGWLGGSLRSPGERTKEQIVATEERLRREINDTERRVLDTVRAVREEAIILSRENNLILCGMVKEMKLRLIARSCILQTGIHMPFMLDTAPDATRVASLTED